MTPDRWALIKEIFGVAREKAPDERPRFLDAACGSDDSLRREVQQLLAEPQDSWLKKPVEASPVSELGAGQALGRYRVEIKLGQGGMGAVYKAHDSVLRRPVALKVLPPGQLADPESRERLTREARAASALNHPNIITVYDISSENGVDFIAMELIEGQPLSELTPVGGMPPAQLLPYATQIARGLVKAHRAGIVHRDLKPSNIMVTGEGLVKLLDFGLARLTRTMAASGASGSLTAEGVISGTPSYMSPEQAEGKSVDARSDIFSFGTVLYEMASGRKAFHSDSQISTLAAVIHEEPPPLEGSVSRDLAELIARCLKKAPEQRFQQMEDVRDALENLKEESVPVVAARQSRKWVGRVLRRHWMLLAGVLAAVAIAVIGMDVFRSAPPLSPPVPLTTLQGREEFPSFSPDGTQVAFTRNTGDGNWDIYIQAVGVGAPLQRTNHPASDRFPAWSPDGRNIAFLRRLKDRIQIVLAPPIGGSEKVLAETEPLSRFMCPRPGWTPDGKWLAYSEPVSPGKQHGIVLMSLETGEKRNLTRPPPGSNDEAPAISPDGKTMAFARGSSVDFWDIHLLGLSSGLLPTGEPRKLGLPDKLNHLPAWTADSRELIYTARHGAGQSTISTILLRTKVGGLLPGISRWRRKVEYLPLTGLDTEAPAISFARRRLAYAQNSSETNIWRVNLTNDSQPGKGEPFIVSARNEGSPQFSPDGRRIAFVSNRTGKPEVWVCDGDGSNMEQLTSLGALTTESPQWSPDGQQIAFGSNPKGINQIYVIPARGGFPKALTNEKDVNGMPSWSRDGRWIYFPSVDGTLRKVLAGGGKAVQATRALGYSPMESYDGRFLYYWKDSRDPWVWRVLVEGGDETKVIQGVMFQNFTLTAKGIFFISPPGQGGRSTIELFDSATGKARPVATIDPLAASGLTVSPDGRTILFTKYDNYGTHLMLVENFQ